MASRVRLIYHAPLIFAARRCSMADVVERDAIRVAQLRAQQRAAHIPDDPNERNRLFTLALTEKPEARTVFYHRLRGGSIRDRILRLVLERVYPGQTGVEIECGDIGPGFALGHGQASVIWAKRIGTDCTIYQHCTLGMRDGQPDTLPVLGDRSWLWPGAKVIGRNVGDDGTVGAGAVVVREDVPARGTAVGVPARVL